MPPSYSSELIWKLAVLPGDSVPVRDYLEGERRRPKRLTFLLQKMRYTAGLGWATAVAQRRFESVEGIEDAHEFRTEFASVQLRVYFTTHHTAEGICLVALAATHEKHGRGRIPAPLKDAIRDRLRQWKTERRMAAWPTREDLTGTVS